MKGKYITIILLLSFIFIGEVKAQNNNVKLTFTNGSITPTNGTAGTLTRLTNTSYFDFTPNQKNSSFRLNFDDLTIPKNTSYFTFPFSILNNNNNEYYSCSSYGIAQSSYTISYQTTYNDGTTSQNDGVINENTGSAFCNEFKSENDKLTLNVAYTFTDNTSNNCNIIGNEQTLNAICPIDNDKSDGTKKIKFITVNFSSNELQNYNSYNVRFSNFFNVVLDSNAQMIEQQQETNTKLDNIDTSINSSNTSGGESAADDLKNNSAFQDNTGLSSIVTAPLSMINSLTSTCSPIRLTIPYLDTTFEIPCIGDLLTSKMGELMQLVKVVINGYICYLIGLDMFKIVKHARDPNDDRIEVLDL